MLKLVYLLRRRPEMSQEAFQTYWRDRHGPLIARLAERLLVRRYVQSHIVDTPLAAATAGPRGCLPADFDGVAELWWDEGALGDHEPERLDAARALLKDEAQFIDLPRSILFFTREHVIVPPADLK